VPTRSTVQDAADSRLTGLALAGAQDAYRELLRRYERPVFNLVLQIVGGRADAEDLTQEVFVKAFRALRQFDPARRFSSWLFKIAHNHALDHLRKSRAPAVSIDTDEHAETLVADGPSPADLTERARLADALRGAIGRLRVEYREAVVLRYQEDLSHEDIADVMGVPVGTVKTYLHRARKDLALVMGAAGWRGSNGRSRPGP
jgi:RNA polymerase sigma-70 factor (ECF subfamily)